MSYSDFLKRGWVIGCALCLPIMQGCKSIVCCQTDTIGLAEKLTPSVGIKVNQTKMLCRPVTHAGNINIERAEKETAAQYISNLESADLLPLFRQKYSQLSCGSEVLELDVKVDCDIDVRVENFYLSGFTLFVIPLKTDIDLKATVTVKPAGIDEKIASTQLSIKTHSAESIAPSAYLANMGRVSGTQINPDEIPEQIVHAIAEAISKIPEDELKRIALIQNANRMIYQNE